jgi:hypothetical protein
MPPTSPLPQTQPLPGIAPKAGGTLHDTVRTMPTPLSERLGAPRRPNYQRAELAPLLEARREEEAEEDAKFQAGMQRAREKIEARLAEKERIRRAINQRERQKQVSGAMRMK